MTKGHKLAALPSVANYPGRLEYLVLAHYIFVPYSIPTTKLFYIGISDYSKSLMPYELFVKNSLFMKLSSIYLLLLHLGLIGQSSFGGATCDAWQDGSGFSILINPSS